MTAGATDMASSTHLTSLTEVQTMAAAWQYDDGAFHHFGFQENATRLR